MIGCDVARCGVVAEFTATPLGQERSYPLCERHAFRWAKVQGEWQRVPVWAGATVVRIEHDCF